MSNLERMRNNGFRMHFWTSVDKLIKDRTWRPALTHCDLATHMDVLTPVKAITQHYIRRVVQEVAYRHVQAVVQQAVTWNIEDRNNT